MTMLEERRGPGRPPRPLPVKLLVDYWPRDGSGRRFAGEELMLPPEEARDIVAKGLAVRNDEF
jgi:hypothetical protein